MKNLFVALTAVLLVTLYSGCEKCFTCHNECKVCTEHHVMGPSDTTLTIIVCSNTFGQEYFTEYIDSLTSPSLGWVCSDTGSNYNEHFCTGTMKKTFELVSKKEEGLICVEE